MMKWVDHFLDRITMYRLILYYLIALVLAAIGLSAAGVLQYSPAAIVFSTVVLVVVCGVSNEIFARVFDVPANFESSYITALILTLIITPKIAGDQLVFLTAAGGLAIASKYILAINKRHIFNPAAVAVALTAAGAGQSASWWVGSSALLPYVIVGGLLMVRKIKRGAMVTAFFAAVFLATIVINIAAHQDVLANLQKTALHSSLFFLAFVMLTEPLTSPTTKGKQIVYAFITGALFPPQVHIGSVYSSPELALLVANVFSYATSFKRRLVPKLLRQEVVAPGIVDFIFQPEKPVKYLPGQYMEWTLPHNKADSRGVRRYLTLASSPTEDTLRIGVKFYQNGSSFKRALLKAGGHTQIAVGQLGGDFTLPHSRDKKLAFIAGGIGVTPYRSMVKYLLDTDDKRDIALLYSEARKEGFAYTDVFNEAVRKLGMKATYTLTDSDLPAGWQGKTGFINADMIAAEIPDYRERVFYISGPHTMVTSVQDALKSLDVPNHQIKTDFFPGYA